MYMYSIGTKVVHPCYGAGTIVRIQEKNIADAKNIYYVIDTVGKPMQIMVPVNQAESAGLRTVGPEQRLRGELASMCTAPDAAEIESDLRTRQGVMQEQLKSGAFLEVVSVVRQLAFMNSRRPLGTMDRQLLDRGKDLLVGELALATSTAVEDAREELELSLAKMTETPEAE